MCHGFQEITWYTTLFNTPARRMQKSLRYRIKHLSDIYGPLKGFWYYKTRSSISKTKDIWFLKTSIVLSLVCSYLKNKRQKVQINNKFSNLKEVTAGVPRGSIDGPLLYKLLINDLFLFLYFSTLSNYAE